MKITFLTAYFAPEITPVTHLFSDLTADLAASGAEVTVVANRAARGLDEKTRAEYAARTDERKDGVRILRVGANAREGRGLASRAVHFLGNTLAIWQRARRIETDVYLINSMPPYLGLVGALLARRAPTVYLLQDIFPDSVIAMGKLRETGAIARAFRWMERVTYRRNTRFVTVSEDMKRTLLHKGIAAERIRVIPNWVDAEQVVPVARAENPVFDRFSLSRDGFYVCYAGTLGILQDIGTLLGAAKLLRQERPEISFLIFGGGALYADTARAIETDGLDTVRLLPLLPVPEAKYAYSAGDVAVVPLRDGVTDIAMPSKTWSALSAARPVVCTARGESAWANMLLASGAAEIAAPGDARALADAIARLYDARETLKERGALGRAFVKKQLARRDATDAYARVLAEAAEGKRQRGKHKYV